MTPDLLFRVLGDRRLRIAVLLVVLALLAHQVSLAIWHLVPAPQMTESTRAAPIQRATQANTDRVNYQQQAGQIGRAFLFGKAEEKKVVEVVVEEAPVTQLNYKLRGIYFSDGEDESSAVIEVKPNNSAIYKEGKELDTKITLHKIEHDHVLLNRYGKIERLNLQTRDPPRGRVVSGLGVSSASQTALLRSYKKRYTSNPMALATRFQAIPVQQDGKNIGFRLKPLRGETLLKKLKFEPNDVFTAVNGVSLKNPFEALDALKSLTTATSVSVTILRNGSEQTLDFQI